MFRAVLLVAALLLTAAAPPPARIEVPTAWPKGDPPVIRVTGLRPGETVELHLARIFSLWVRAEDGNWRSTPAPTVGWARFKADAKGVVDTSRAKALEGTYAGTDVYGLWWSARRTNDAQLPAKAPPGLALEALQDGEARLVLVRGGEAVAQTPLKFGIKASLRLETVSEGLVNGEYAAPTGQGRLPTLILLHGSEGGDGPNMRWLAAQFAHQGYAVFALNYFAWDLKGLDVRNDHVNLPIETLEPVREWLGRQPEVDLERFGLYGHSKGAEFAEVAAVRYPWVKAIIACVPTDVVWEGYGIGDGRNTRTRPNPDAMSSWSWKGEPLPYVPLRPFVFGQANPYFNNTERYERSRAEHPAEAQAAAIPLEQTSAQVLLLGGGRDEVWASGAMAWRLDARFAKAGKSDQVETHIYPTAGHQICGDGTYPTHLWMDQGNDPRSKDLVAEGRAAADAWQRMQTFLRRVL
jgi:dienelactone hydrolase